MYRKLYHSNATFDWPSQPGVIILYCQLFLRQSVVNKHNCAPVRREILPITGRRSVCLYAYCHFIKYQADDCIAGKV